MTVAVFLRDEEQFARVFRTGFEDNGQRRLPFVVRLFDHWDYLLALAADVVHIEKRSSLCVFVDAIDEQACVVGRPDHTTNTAHAFGFWKLDLERCLAAAVGERRHNLLLGPASSWPTGGNILWKEVWDNELTLLRAVGDDIRRHSRVFTRRYTTDRNELCGIGFACDLDDRGVCRVQDKTVAALREEYAIAIQKTCTEFRSLSSRVTLYRSVGDGHHI